MVSQKEEVRQARLTRRNWLVVLVLIGLLTLLSFPTTRYFDMSRLDVGEPSPVTYRVDQRYRLVDRERTESKRQRALASVRPRFVEDVTKRRRILEDFRTEIRSLRDGDRTLDGIDLPDTRRDWDRLQEIALLVARFLLDQGIISDRDVFDQFTHQKRGIVRSIPEDASDQGVFGSRREVALSDLRNRLIGTAEVKARARGMMSDLYPNFDYAPAVLKLVERIVRPTVYFDKEQFEDRVQSALNGVEPFFHTFEEGEVVLRSGETVNEEHRRVLKAMNNKKVRFQLLGGAASLGVVLLGVGFFYFYFREFEPGLLEQSNKIALMGSLVVILAAGAKAVELMETGFPAGVEYGLPFAAPIMLVALLVGAGAAFLLTLVMGLFVVTFFGFQFELLVLFLAGGLAGVLGIRQVKRRVMLIQSGFVVAGAQIAAVAFFHVVHHGTLLEAELGTHLLWAGVNGGLLVPFVIMGLLPFLESGFGITTSFSLLELADLSHPLLRTLFQRAPGTFQHSIMLSHLCERAAENVGADGLLARVGAYYHDLGKSENPQYFIENQTQSENPHDELKPTLSASILKAHVKKGSEMAREEGLPDEIVDFIEQHHGTTLMKPFYYEALKEQEDVSREEFQYPGPRPQTRETGICMLADTAEAACRALDDPRPQEIRDRINEVVRSKITAGQLDECPLTFQDVETIIDTFTRVMTSAGHRRIEYPDEDETRELESDRDARAEMEPS